MKTLLTISVVIFLALATGYYQYTHSLTVTPQSQWEASCVWRFWHGSLGSVWQYRVWTQWIDRGLTNIFRPKSLIGNEFETIAWDLGVSWGHRIALNILIYFTLWVYLQTLGIKRILPILIIFTPILCLAEIPSGLAHCSYWELLFFMWSGIAVLKNKLWVTLLLLIPATLNRETAILIPILIILWAWTTKNLKSGLIISGFGFAIWGGIEYILHRSFPPQISQTINWPALTPGLNCLWHNLSSLTAWAALGAMFIPVLILSLYDYLEWPQILRTWFWGFVTPYCLAMFFFGNIRETRLFLNPLVMVILPGIGFHKRRDYV